MGGQIDLVGFLDESVGVPRPVGDRVDGPLQDLALIAFCHGCEW
jgi:hypothetical protein